MELKKTSGNSGDLPRVKYEDRELSVSFFCPAMLEHIEEYIVNQAYECCQKIKNKTLKAKAEAEFFTALHSQQFSPNGDNWEKVMSSDLSQVLVLWSCIYENHRDFTPDDCLKLIVNNGADVRIAMIQVLPDFFRVRARLKGASPEKMAEVEEEIQKKLPELESMVK